MGTITLDLLVELFPNAAEQTSLNRGENCGFYSYFRDGMKASMSALTKKETSVAQ